MDVFRDHFNGFQSVFFLSLLDSSISKCDLSGPFLPMECFLNCIQAVQCREGVTVSRNKSLLSTLKRKMSKT